MLQHEIFLENENQAMKQLMMGLTNKNLPPTLPKPNNQTNQKHENDANFKLEDL